MFIYNAGWIPQVDEEGNLVQEQSNVEDSTIYVLDSCEQVSISECKNCRIVVAPVSGSIFLIDCVDCVCSIAAKQIRLRNCQRCELRNWTPNSQALIIEVSTELTVGPWDISYPELAS